MTYFIGGTLHGKKVPQDKLYDTNIPDWEEKLTTIAAKRKSYKPLKISFEGTIKTFFIIEGAQPIDFRSEILELWTNVPTEVYAI